MFVCAKKTPRRRKTERIYVYPLVIKHGNWKSPVNGGVNGKIIYKRGMFCCHVWLPKGVAPSWVLKGQWSPVVSPAVQPCQSIIFIMAISCLKRSMFFILPSQNGVWSHYVPFNTCSHLKNCILGWDLEWSPIHHQEQTIWIHCVVFVYLWDSTWMQESP